MPHDTEEKARLVRHDSKQAIALAMEGRWREAVAANKGIIENYPDDIDAYNRLGRAYMELGEYELSRIAYSRAREMDPYNSIAEKNLRRLSHLGETVIISNEESRPVEPQVFIEETGKAGVVSLYRLAPQQVLAGTDAGDKVNLKIDGLRLVVEDGHGQYLGEVDPKHSQRLIKLMRGGNEYAANVISSSDEMLAIIIRETYQHPSQEGYLSFPSKGFGSLRSYVSDKILRRQLEYDESASDADYLAAGEEDSDLLGGESADDEDGGEEEEEEQEV
jgi:tetratricopeptide (TPR) repeat protein